MSDLSSAPLDALQSATNVRVPCLHEPPQGDDEGHCASARVGMSCYSTRSADMLTAADCAAWFIDVCRRRPRAWHAASFTLHVTCYSPGATGALFLPRAEARP